VLVAIIATTVLGQPRLRELGGIPVISSDFLA
jgi:hypothetical protein